MSKRNEKQLEKIKKTLSISIALSENGPLSKFVSKESIKLQLNFVKTLQRVTNSSKLVSEISFLGSGKFVLLVVVLLQWFGDPVLGWAPSRNIAVTLSICGIMKAIMKGPRPYWLDDKIHPLDPTLEASFGFPSGHTAGSIALYGHIAYHYYSPSLALFVTFICIAISISRVQTGAHFVHDIVGGAIVGLISLLLTTGSLGVEWHENRGSSTDAVFLIILSLSTLATVILTNLNKQRLVNYKDVKESVSGAGLVFGVGLCHIAVRYVSVPRVLPLPIQGTLFELTGMIVIERLTKLVSHDGNGCYSVVGILLISLLHGFLQVHGHILTPFIMSYLSAEP